MQFGVMITNNGAHPADKWAAQTAGSICELIQVDDSSSSPEAVKARMAKPRLELAMTEALLDHHAHVQESEKDHLAEHGDADHDPDDDVVEEAVSAIESAAVGTPFEEHFAKQQTKDVVRSIVKSHFATSMDIERGWHKSRQS